MTERTIARTGVFPIGLGCMGMTWAYGSNDRNAPAHERVIQRAIDEGAALLDTADVYGPCTNEELVGRAIRGRRDRAFVATKCGLVRRSAEPSDIGPNGRPEHVRASIDGSLRRLGVDYVDLYQLHRVDRDIPLEETWGAMAEVVVAGKARAIGLSEVSIEQIERARLVHPVASVQSELSLWTRDNLPVARHCAEKGITFLAYSPLGRGFLTGRFKCPDDFDEDDWRRSSPRFRDAETMAKNYALVRALERIGCRLGATPGQVALAWTLAQSETVIAIPGTRRIERLEENLHARRLCLDAEDLDELDALPAAAGARY